MNTNDILWKGIIEDAPIHFFKFFLPHTEKVIDFSRPFEYMDKDLEAIFPTEDTMKPRYVDKLIKVYTVSGEAEYILVHIEVQGYRDKDFGIRMFTYFYRLLDRYQKPVTALAIFTDDNPGYFPSEYACDFLGTSVVYRFNGYKVHHQDEAELAGHPNPFALVVLTVLVAIRHKKVTDDDLMQLKLDLFRRCLGYKMDKGTLRAMVNFLKNYIRFAKSESYLTFEKEIKLITNDNTTMGIEELILDMAKKEGIEKGAIDTLEAVVTNLIVKLGLTNEQAADVAGVTPEFVAEIREKLGR